MSEESKTRGIFSRYTSIFIFLLWILIYTILYINKVDRYIFTMLFPFIYFICILLIKVDKMEDKIQNMEDRLKDLEK